MIDAPEAQEWHRVVIRASVREETYQLQAQAGPVTVQGIETIPTRASVPILAQLEDKPPELVATLLPSLVRVMLAAFVEGDGGAASDPRRYLVMAPRSDDGDQQGLTAPIVMAIGGWKTERMMRRYARGGDRSDTPGSGGGGSGSG